MKRFAPETGAIYLKDIHEDMSSTSGIGLFVNAWPLERWRLLFTAARNQQATL